MNEIRISQEEMYLKASAFDTQREKLEEAVTELGRQADLLLEEWMGQSSQKFNEKFHSYDSTFKDVEQLIADMAQQIRDVASSMTEVDQMIAGRISGM